MPEWHMKLTRQSQVPAGVAGSRSIQQNIAHAGGVLGKQEVKDSDSKAL